MKKMLLLFLLLTTGIFAQWETIELVNEFNEKTGAVAIVNMSPDLNFLKFYKQDDKYEFTGFSQKYLGGKGQYYTTEFKVKNENNEVFKKHGYVSHSNGKLYTLSSSKDAKKFIEFLKKSKTLKVIVTTYNDNKILMEFDSSNFNEMIDLVK